MRLLEFEVKQQRLSKMPGCDFSHIVAGTDGYLRAKFNFSKEWEGCVKVASFFDEDRREYCVVLDKDDSCDIPAGALVGGYFDVEVTGAKTGLVNESYKIKTIEYRVKQIIS